MDGFARGRGGRRRRTPRTASVSELLWPEALLDLGSTSREAGIARLVDADARWTPEVAHTNHLRALQRLDWRWRIQQIARDLGVRTATLDSELERLRHRIDVLDLGRG